MSKSAQFLEQIIVAMEKRIEDDPNISASVLVNELKVALQIAEDSLKPSPVGSCINCQRPVVFDTTNVLKHLGPSGTIESRSCRAASFEWLDGQWDESLARELIAKI